MWFFRYGVPETNPKKGSLKKQTDPAVNQFHLRPGVVLLVHGHWASRFPARQQRIS